MGKGLIHLGFAAGAADILPKYRPKEFFRPAQVDSRGNFNNIAFGKDYQRPRMRLPGSGGIPDVTPLYDHSFLYVPRHSRLTFAAKIDFLSGLGHAPQRKQGEEDPDIWYLTWVSLTGGKDACASPHCTPIPISKRSNARPALNWQIAPDLYKTPPPDAEDLEALARRD